MSSSTSSCRPSVSFLKAKTNFSSYFPYGFGWNSIQEVMIQCHWAIVNTIPYLRGQVKICTILYSFHSIWKTKFVRRIYRNILNALIFMKIDLVQSIFYISTERDLYAHFSLLFCTILVKFVCKRSACNAFENRRLS